MKKSDIFWQTYLNLEKEIIEISKFIFITDQQVVNRNGVEEIKSDDAQLKTYSPHIADLLVRCCVQIEAISKELYYDNGGSKQRGNGTIFFDEDCLKLIDKKWETHNKRVLLVAPFFRLTKEENRILRPLKEAHKRGGTLWEKAYQAVKHDRYYSLHKGNIKALICALAALYLLNLYYRSDSWITKYMDISKVDYSMGSAIFAVNPPSKELLWSENLPQMSASPYVVTYQTNDDYKRMKEMQRAEKMALYDFLMKQPELQQPEFLHLINTSNWMIPMCEQLGKHRLNKLIPKSQPFEERKKLLINSEAWNSWINQNNKHLAPDEITEENIQREVDLVGIRWGMEIMKKFLKNKWLPMAMNSVCKIYIP